MLYMILLPEGTFQRNAHYWNSGTPFIEIALWHGCSPVNLLHIFRIPFPKNISERLLQYFIKSFGNLAFGLNLLTHSIRLPDICASSSFKKMAKRRTRRHERKWSMESIPYLSYKTKNQKKKLLRLVRTQNELQVKRSGKIKII